MLISYAKISERSHNLLDGIIQGLADLVCEDFTYPFKIPPETHPVFLDVLVAHLSHEIVQDAVFLAEVDDFHISVVLILTKLGNF